MTSKIAVRKPSTDSLGFEKKKLDSKISILNLKIHARNSKILFLSFLIKIKTFLISF